MAVNDFDFIAPFYDRMAKAVFGNRLLQAKIYHINEVKSDDKVLILGGGTGDILEYIAEGASIHYLDKSEKMIHRARNLRYDREIEFFIQDFAEFNTATKYDFIICPFFLDCFAEEQLNSIVKKIKSLLKEEGQLLVTDFQQSNSNALLLKFMHLFFKISAKLEARSLLDIHRIVISTGFRLEKEKISHRNQLFSRLYRNL